MPARRIGHEMSAKQSLMNLTDLRHGVLSLHFLTLLSLYLVLLLDNEALTSLLFAFCSCMDVCPFSLTSRIQIMTSSAVSTLQDCTFSGLEAKL